MANVRDSDTSLWLHNKLGTSSDSWTGGSIDSQLNAEVLKNIKQCFPDLQTQVKLKLLLSFLHFPRRGLEEWRVQLEEIIDIAITDSDRWVSVLAEMMKKYPSTCSLNSELAISENKRIFYDLVHDLKKLVKKQTDFNMLPFECHYLNRAALASVVGQMPTAKKHFTLRRKPKSAAVKAELIQKSIDMASNMKKNITPTVPVRSRGMPRKMTDTTPLKGIPSRIPSSGFRGIVVTSNSRSSLPRTLTGRKDVGIKFLDIAEQPVGYAQAKKRKRMQELEDSKRMLEDSSLMNNESNSASLSSVDDLNPPPTPTPDYAAGLLALNPPTPAPSLLSTQTSTSSHIPSYAPISVQTVNISQTTSYTSQSNVSQPPSYAPPSVQRFSPPPTPSYMPPSVQRPSPPSSPQYISLSSSSTLHSTNYNVTNNSKPPRLLYSSLQPVSPDNTETGEHNYNSIESPGDVSPNSSPEHEPDSPPTATRTTSIVTRGPYRQEPTSITIIHPAPQSVMPDLPFDDDQRQEIAEMFKTANKVTRPEKALIIAFMAGSRLNPCPQLGNVVTVKLSENIENVEQTNGTYLTMNVETHFQMDYNNGHWKRIKKYRDISAG